MSSGSVKTYDTAPESSTFDEAFTEAAPEASWETDGLAPAEAGQPARARQSASLQSQVGNARLGTMLESAPQSTARGLVSDVWGGPKASVWRVAVDAAMPQRVMLRALAAIRRRVIAEFRSTGDAGTGGMLDQIDDAMTIVEDASDTVMSVQDELLEGAVLGDLKENPTIWNTIGQVGAGFIPIVGQLGDIRDTVASIRKLWKGGWRDPWEWVNLGLTLIAWFPGLGDALKAAGKVAVRFLRGKVGKAIAVGRQLIGKIADRLPTWFGKARRLGGRAWSAVQGAGGRAWSSIKAGGGRLWRGAKDTVAAIRRPVASIRPLARRGATLAKEQLARLAQGASDVRKRIAEGIREVWDRVTRRRARTTAKPATAADLIKNGTEFKGSRLPPFEGPPNGTLYKRDPRTGKITNYTVYDHDGCAIKRVDLTGATHGGVPTPHVVEYTKHGPDPRTGKPFAREQKYVRPARPDESP